MDAPTAEELNEAKDTAKAALNPDTFDFAQAVMDRNYPEFDVPVYLDEKQAQEFIDVHDERYLLEEKLRAAKAAKPGAPITKVRVEQAERLAELDEKYDEVTKRLESSKYVIKIKGISPEKNIELEALANEQFPIEYEETVNPITGAKTREPIANEKREAYYASLIRQAHIISVTAPNGAVDEDWSDVAKVQKTISNLPFLARNYVDDAVNKATITADFYRVLVDPVF